MSEKNGSDDDNDALPAESWDSTVQILERAKSGDRSATRLLLERALPSLKRFSHRRIPSYARGTEDTEDLVQNAVLQTLKRIDTFEHRTVGALQAFLREVVMNRVRDIVRRVQRRGVPIEPAEDLTDTEPSPLERAIMNQQMDRFVEALQRLRPADRQAIIWRIELGYSYEEIANRLGKPSVPAARMAVSRALQRLAKELGISESDARSVRGSDE
jgi:RNA polymerase sigma-70 factor (ECF subfamily)